MLTLTEYSSSKGTKCVNLCLSSFSIYPDLYHFRIPDEELTFIHPDDVELYNAWDSRAFELQVANHELLGHGSGKLFKEGADGKRNFDPEKVCLFFALLSSEFSGLYPFAAKDNKPADRQTHVRFEPFHALADFSYMFSFLARHGTNLARLRTPY